MKISISKSIALATALASVSTEIHAQSLLDQVQDAVTQGTSKVSFRGRYESVEQDNALRDASAGTLRTRLTIESGVVNGFSGLLEIDNVSTVGTDRYDSLVSDRYRGTYSVIADPVGSEVNQAYVNYVFDERQSVRLGMQRVNHATQRFLGSVGWRQNEQTLDAVSYSRTSSKFSLDYSYIWNVNRIFGASKASVQPTNLDSNSHIVYSTYKTDMGTLAGFVYALDFDEADTLSSLSYGLSYAHSFSNFTVNASLALQSDYGGNTNSYDTDFLSVDISYDFEAMKLLLGHEILGSDSGGAAFQTPLATLHKWQGWADLFLTTPADGIHDSFITLSGKLGKAALAASYHSFSADEGSMDYGSEWDLVASYPLLSNLALELKYANYDSDGFKVDTNRLWLSLNLAF